MRHERERQTESIEKKGGRLWAEGGIQREFYISVPYILPTHNYWSTVPHIKGWWTRFNFNSEAAQIFYHMEPLSCFSFCSGSKEVESFQKTSPCFSLESCYCCCCCCWSDDWLYSLPHHLYLHCMYTLPPTCPRRPNNGANTSFTNICMHHVQHHKKPRLGINLVVYKFLNNKIPPSLDNLKNLKRFNCEECFAVGRLGEAIDISSLSVGDDEAHDEGKVLAESLSHFPQLLHLTLSHISTF